MTVEDAMVRLMALYREYAEYYECNEETDKAIIMAIVAMSKYEPSQVTIDGSNYTPLFVKEKINV